MSAAAIQLDASERWRGPGSPIGRASRTMMLIALASLAAHLLVVAAAVMSARQPPAPPAEISVEVVQEVPKPAPEAPKPSEPAKRAEAAAPTPPAPKPQPKTEPAKTEPAKPEPAKPPSPAKSAAAPPPQPKAAAEDQKLAALQKELDSLRAEQASLQAERAAEAAAQARAPAPLRDTGLGPLPDSFQAVALPAAGDGAGEAASYQEIVFSALAKAKGFGRTKGVPGSAGVRFSIDAAGRLVDVELVHRSGVPSLDAQALDIVRRAAPFPPPPQGAQRSFSANVNFVTEGAR